MAIQETTEIQRARAERNGKKLMARMNPAPLVTGLTCLRCGWSWYPRRPEPPKVCPRCKRIDWHEASAGETK